MTYLGDLMDLLYLLVVSAAVPVNVKGKGRNKGRSRDRMTPKVVVLAPISLVSML